MSNMKVATVRQVQHGLAKLLEQVKNGHEIAVTKRGLVVAKIVPVQARAKSLRWPDSASRMKRLPKGAMTGKRPSAIIDEMRRERL
jgi:prevent-host-death family protein